MFGCTTLIKFSVDGSFIGFQTGWKSRDGLHWGLRHLLIHVCRRVKLLCVVWVWSSQRNRHSAALLWILVFLWYAALKSSRAPLAAALFFFPVLFIFFSSLCWIFSVQLAPNQKPFKHLKKKPSARLMNIPRPWWFRGPSGLDFRSKRSFLTDAGVCWDRIVICSHSQTI